MLHYFRFVSVIFSIYPWLLSHLHSLQFQNVSAGRATKINRDYKSTGTSTVMCMHRHLDRFY